MHTRRHESAQEEMEREREESRLMEELRWTLTRATDKYCKRCGSLLYIMSFVKKDKSVVKTRSRLLAEDMGIKDPNADEAVNLNGGSNMDQSEAAVTYTCLNDDCEMQGFVVVMWTTSPQKPRRRPSI